MARELVKRRPSSYAPSAGVYGYEWKDPGCLLAVAGLVGSVAMFVPTGGLAGAMMVSIAVHSIPFACF